MVIKYLNNCFNFVFQFIFETKKVIAFFLLCMFHFHCSNILGQFKMVTEAQNRSMAVAIFLLMKYDLIK